MKKYIYFSIAIASLLFTSCMEEESDLTVREMVFGLGDETLGSAKNYDAYSSDQRESFFLEEFNNNNLNWPVLSGNSAYYQMIYDGYFWIFSAATNNPVNSTSNQLPGIDNSRNYEFEVRFKNIEIGNSETVYKITLAPYANSEINGIWIQNDGINGNFSIRNYVQDGNFTDWNRYYDKTVNYNSPSDFDKITVRHVSGKWFIFVNEVFQDQINSLPLYTHYFRFYANKSAQIDYIKMDYLINL